VDTVDLVGMWLLDVIAVVAEVESMVDLILGDCHDLFKDVTEGSRDGSDSPGDIFQATWLHSTQLTLRCFFILS